VPFLAFLSGVMRSICDDHWRRALRRHGDLADLDAFVGDDTPDPERMLAAAQALAEVHRLFAGDPPALKIVAGLAEGLTASEICRLHGMEERAYDTARKRIRRTLLRCGLSRSVR
jgi:DNA-directed RNA polymerase specialized sigma24 family protein